MHKKDLARVADKSFLAMLFCGPMTQSRLLFMNRPIGQARRERGAEGVIARGPGDTEGPWVQNCQDRIQNYGLRTPLVYLGGAIVLCTPPPF